MKRAAVQGHGMALLAVLIWGMTFLASKVLVTTLDPYEIIVVRFFLAWLVLFLLSPKPLKLRGWKGEGPILLCALTGVPLYYIFQNVALVHTTASNTGVISACSPLFTALILWLFSKTVRLKPLFFLGFLLAIGGVVLITFSGSGEGVSLHGFGDLMAVGAAAAWGVYCVLLDKVDHGGLTELQLTRKIFFWGLLMSLPPMLLWGTGFHFRAMASSVSLWGNLLFVAVLSSALCYLLWGRATILIGAVRTSVYLYLIPVISVAASALLLHEEVTGQTVLAIALIFAGLFLSQKGCLHKLPEEEPPTF